MFQISVNWKTSCPFQSNRSDHSLASSLFGLCGHYPAAESQLSQLSASESRRCERGVKSTASLSQAMDDGSVMRAENRHADRGTTAHRDMEDQLSFCASCHMLLSLWGIMGNQHVRVLARVCVWTHWYFSLCRILQNIESVSFFILFISWLLV